MAKRKISNSKKAEVVRLYRSGKDAKEVAEKYGVSLQSVYNWNKSFPSQLPEAKPKELELIKEEETSIAKELSVLRKQNKARASEIKNLKIMVADLCMQIRAFKGKEEIVDILFI